MQLVLPKIIEKQMIEVNRLYTFHSENQLLNQHFPTSVDGIDQSIYNNIIIIHSMLQSSGLAMSTINTLCTAGALIEAALDYHEQIEKYDTSEITSRQLAILAGDYYSSKYYKLLADANLIDAIQIFAKSIQQINEAKMSRHFANYNDISINKYVMWLENINASIAINLVEEYAIDKENWYDICRNVLIVQALLDEQNYVLPSYRGFISFKLLLLYKVVDSSTQENFIDIILDQDKTNFLLVKHNIHHSYCKYIDEYLTIAIESVEKLQTKFIKDELIQYLKEMKIQNMSQVLANK